MSSIVLVTIAKNESGSIGRLIESVQHRVDQIIIVDTGSSDGTVEIARAYGALVRHFDWIEDFSAARNFALSLTTAPWRLVLDADEWVHAWPNDFNVRNDINHFVGRVELRSTFNTKIENKTETLVTRTRLSRLLPQGVQYSGAIHESPRHSLPVRDVPLIVLHDGYEDQQLIRKGDRNFLILKRLIDQGATDPYIFYQFGKELYRMGEYRAAVDRFIRSREMLGDRHCEWRQSLICTTLNALSEAFMIDEGLTLIDDEASLYFNSSIFWFSVGSFLMSSVQRHPNLAEKFFPLIENAFCHCLEIGDADNSGEQLVGAGSFLAVRNLTALYLATGRHSAAAALRSLL